MSWTDAFDIERNRTLQVYECRPSLLGYSGTSPYYYPILTITGCSSTKESCYNKGISVMDKWTPWIHYPSSRLFLNKFCALCNGIDLLNGTSFDSVTTFPISPAYYECNATVSQLLNTTVNETEKYFTQVRLCRLVLIREVLRISLGQQRYKLDLLFRNYLPTDFTLWKSCLAVIPTFGLFIIHGMIRLLTM
jgi:hypothetical protein